MFTKSFVLLVLAAGAVHFTHADEAISRAEPDRLLRIQHTLCIDKESFIFLPVSHDDPALTPTFALIDSNNPNPASVEIVTKKERTWLMKQPCPSSQNAQKHYASSALVEQNF